MEPKVSVVIPVYNSMKYLTDCIESLLAQTMQEIEFIFVDDASTDDSLALLRKYERAYPEKIKVVASSKNLRQGGARNIGIRQARGEWIGFVDSDDYVMPTMYENLYESAKKDKMGHIEAIVGKYAEVENDCSYQECFDRKLIGMPNWSKQLLTICGGGTELTDTDRERLIAEDIGGIWVGIWKKSVLIENEIWFPENLMYEDNYWMSLVRCYLNGIDVVDKVVYIHRLSENSTVRSRNSRNHFDRIVADKLLQEEVKKRGLENRYSKAWEFIYAFRYCFTTYYQFMDFYDKPDISVLKELIQQLKRNYPNWIKNTYLVERTSNKYRMLCKMAATAPILTGLLYRFFYRK